ncbi:RNA polymerase sigma factor [Clostridium thermarum]|uniref:RNA polymerase sigma factor n=1 Tax=Clostridium thermarum TaxID=1716543 RepID=UPI001FA97F11|nr:sigma-70 family RNA polymerase sigma factor [Clostridium thermarum]
MELIKAAQNKDRDAFRSLFAMYKQKVYGTAYLILKDYQHSEDIVQETFLQVYLKLEKLKDPQYFERWLYKITVNLCLDAVRKLKKHPLSSLDEYIELKPDFSLTDAKTPEAVAEYKEIQKKILSCIYSLPSQYAAVLVLFYYNNFTIKEISDIINCSEATVKTRLFRARKNLEKVLSKEQLDTIDSSIGGASNEYR